jgi:predicted RNA-binding protein with PUA-like domain
VVKVVKEFYQDPTIDDDRWVVVDVAPEYALQNPVSLQDVKSDERLNMMALVKNTRLSVQPVRKEEFEIIIEKGQ